MNAEQLPEPDVAAALIMRFSHLRLNKGEQRSIYLCGTCGEPFVSDYIPFGTGRGRQHYSCRCFLGESPSNFFMRAKHVCDIDGTE